MPLCDSLFSGNFIIYGDELDEVNDVSIGTNIEEPVAKWQLKYELGFSPYWILWLLIVLLVILCIKAIVKSIIRRIREHRMNQVLEKHPFLMKQRDQLNGSASQGLSWRERRKLLKKYYDEAYKMEQYIVDRSNSVSSRARKLEELRLYIGDIQDKNANKNVWSSLRKKTQRALDELNIKVWGPTPAAEKNGRWESTARGHKFVLYTNNPYYPKCEQLGFTSCNYGFDGNPDYDDVTYPNTVVNIEELYDEYSISELKKRGGGTSFSGSFQDVAQDRIANRNIMKIENYWDENHPDRQFDLYKAYYEWRDSLDLVPHEDGNCKTMRLVKRPAHKAFTHSGGIARACIIKKYFG